MTLKREEPGVASAEPFRMLWNEKMNIRIVPLRQGVNIAPAEISRDCADFYDGPHVRELEASDAELFDKDPALDYVIREFRASDFRNESEVADLEETHILVLVFRSGFRLTRPFYASDFGTRRWKSPQDRAHAFAVALLRRGEAGVAPLVRPVCGHITFLASLIGLTEFEALRRLKAHRSLH